MERVRAVNPFAKRESHDNRSLIIYKTLTILSWLLVLVLSVIYSFDAPSDGRKSHNHTIWGQNKHHRTPFSLNPFITDVYWLTLLVLQVGYVRQLFSNKAEWVTAAANVGSHFILNNLLQSAFLLLWVRGHLWPAELMLVLNFFNLTSVYFRHPATPNQVHIPVVSGPLAWNYVALFWCGAAMVGAHSLPARIVANVFIWSFLLYGMFFLVVFKDYTMGFNMSVLTASLAVHQFFIRAVAFQWIFGFVIMGVLFFLTLAVAVPPYFGKEPAFINDGVVSEDREREPLLDAEA
ncbi:Protein of unknown function DUF1774, fungi [Lasallia pustulata]|uniref:DUF1774-domain-containing protein n=1 Tax=Lasallia pustulata TaxID=136370 RepID=A0A1W5DCX5_9LECA|nr:Protein of unknown function DUF1774, fungi [Lasallia pustulata]